MIRNARKAKGLSQEALAVQSKVSRNYVSLLELNTKAPTVTVLLRLARALGVRASVLIREMEGMLPERERWWEVGEAGSRARVVRGGERSGSR